MCKVQYCRLVFCIFIEKYFAYTFNSTVIITNKIQHKAVHENMSGGFDILNDIKLTPLYRKMNFIRNVNEHQIIIV